MTLPRPPLSPTATWRPRRVGGRVAQGGPGPHRRDQLGVVVPALEAQQFLEGRPADDPVDREAGVALELPERPHGGVAEDPVHPAGVEAERAQALLELGDVVTPQHRGPAVQEAVAQPETGLDQGVPGLGAADPVHAEAPEPLEGLDGGAGGGAEDPVGVDGRAREDGAEPVLDVGDRVAAVADGEREAYR